MGHQDHQKVEDFLATAPAGVGAITLHSTYAKHQQTVGEAARELGLDVLYDPRTERLAYEDPNGATRKLPGWTGIPYDVDRLAGDASQRSALVERVLGGHPEVATIITPPAFLVTDKRSANLNANLAEEARMRSDRPVRAKLLVGSRVPWAVLEELADEYASAGIDALDLRVTPLDGEYDGANKIKYLFSLADLFREHGMHVVLGSSGNIGQVAYALGHARNRLPIGPGPSSYMADEPTPDRRLKLDAALVVIEEVPSPGGCLLIRARQVSRPLHQTTVLLAESLRRVVV
ncbi:hypothetical protein [Microbacterium kunmingense]|uniref:hypothetical protein n=1 Tax=Microbacterium kunmingense TaxID=2915939 RepID=UPI002004931C|nr:hypothetical protein [Microbacterium kunmingense]